MKNAGIPQFNHICRHALNKLWLVEHIRGGTYKAIGKGPIKNAKAGLFLFFFRYEKSVIHT